VRNTAMFGSYGDLSLSFFLQARQVCKLND